jgi:alpha/beta superfamily hydrolase
VTPVYINGCYNALHEAGGGRGVVICGSLGDEELNLHRSQVALAERLAQAGFPTLRVSYYGTGDSAGSDGEPERLRAWIDSIIASVQWLRTTHNLSQVTLCGVRIGAVLAAEAANQLDCADAIVMFAPVSGKRFLRERILAARTVAEIWQSHSPIDDGEWFEAHGLRLDLATRDALSDLDLRKVKLPHVARILVLNPQAVSVRFRAERAEITEEVLDGYERWLRDSHEAEPPYAAFERVVAWLGDPRSVVVSERRIPPQSLELGGLWETPVSFGPAGALSGILATPSHKVSDLPVVLIANTGANPRYGNSRSLASLARWLADQGINSLRMDGHGIGDAAPSTGDTGAPYSVTGNADVISGVDFLAQRFDAPIVVLGMCSGAYHAFQAALTDARINALILVNLQKFVWEGNESLTVVQRTTLRTTGFYLRNLVNPGMWRRMMLGKVNISGIVRALAGRAVRQLAAAADPAIAAVNGETQVGMVRRQLAELTERGVGILYVLSGNDPGLDEISEYFGVRGWRLRRNRNVTFVTIRRADHTLSAHWAREHLKQVIAPYLCRHIGVRAHESAPADVARSPFCGSSGGSPSGNVIDSAQTAA